MERAGLDRAVAELAEHGVGLLAVVERQRRAGGDRQVRADDAPAAEEAALTSSRCIEPPRPWATPVSLPNSSAITAAGGLPTASAVPWSR